MAKNIIKEIIIMLLLCLAIILILGVLLYEYVPSNKIIPDQVSYTTPEAVKEELSKTEDVDSDEVILTYSVDSTDLDNYERINTYVPGKPNPFSSYETSSSTGEDNSQSGETNNNTSSSGTNTNTSNSGGSAYYPNTGTK